MNREMLLKHKDKSKKLKKKNIQQKKITDITNKI